MIKKEFTRSARAPMAMKCMRMALQFRQLKPNDNLQPMA